MRLPNPCSAGVALLLCVATAFAWSPTPDAVLHVGQIEAAKAQNPPGHPNPIYIDVDGDTMASAIQILGLPFSDSGNTCEYAHDYNSICPYPTSGSPDVVYRFAPASDVAISVDLCTSLYDTKVYVFQDTVNNTIACNDDWCGTGLPGPWQSQLIHVLLSAGHVYYVVVDGYSSTDCGTYSLSVAEYVGCDIACPSGGFVEGEPNCSAGYVDVSNGGCNSIPPTFGWIPPCSGDGEATFCGTYGGFANGDLDARDTDWYQLDLYQSWTVSWCVTGEYDTFIGIIDGRSGCPAESFDYGASTGPCAEGCLTVHLPLGTWWLFVATSNFGTSAGACGGDYVARLSYYPCNDLALEPSSWGRIKSIYR